MVLILCQNLEVPHVILGISRAELQIFLLDVTEMDFDGLILNYIFFCVSINAPRSNASVVSLYSFWNYFEIDSFICFLLDWWYHKEPLPNKSSFSVVLNFRSTWLIRCKWRWEKWVAQQQMYPKFWRRFLKLRRYACLGI